MKITLFMELVITFLIVGTVFGILDAIFGGKQLVVTDVLIVSFAMLWCHHEEKKLSQSNEVKNET